MLIDLRELATPLALKSDVCIVGGGPAGITLARALGRAGIETCLLESGGLSSEPEAHALTLTEPTGQAAVDGLIGACRLRYLGGASNHWGGWCAPLTPLDLARRGWVPSSGWPLSWEELERWYPEAHRVCQLGPYPTEAALPADEARRPPPFLSAKLAVRHWQFSPPTRFGIVYRSELADSDRIRVYLHANVVGLAANAAASHVMAARIHGPYGARGTVRARRFVLACGTVENARLLLLSNDVQPEGLGNGSDLVGRFFMQHPEVDTATVLVHDGRALMHAFERYRAQDFSTRAGLFVSADAQRRHGILSWGATLHPLAGGDPDYDAVKTLMPDTRRAGDDLTDAVAALARTLDAPSGGEGAVQLRIRSRCEQVPNPGSRVDLGEQLDPLGLPRARVDWRLGELERRSVEIANHLLGEELGRLGLGRLRLDEWLLTPAGDWPQPLWGGCHHMGTTRMAASPREGVVDHQCKVHGIDNLYVAGSSVFTTSGCINPTLTIVALALRLADHLARAAQA